MADAFQSNAFQNDTFQIEIEGDAFQCGVFQDNAFQTCEVIEEVIPFVGGGRLKRRKRQIKEDEEIMAIVDAFLHTRRH